MWLLDANMPVQLVALLRDDFGVNADHAVNLGWTALSNGLLVKSAIDGGFSAILTRDRLFGESAASALKGQREFCIVLITLPQLRAPQFLQAFQGAWQIAKIITAPGQMIEWPAR
jgi:uncharacterized protein DUF5615